MIRKTEKKLSKKAVQRAAIKRVQANGAQAAQAQKARGRIYHHNTATAVNTPAVGNRQALMAPMCRL